MNALAYAESENPRQHGRYLAELKRSHASGFHGDRRTKRNRARTTQRLNAIKEQL